MIAYTVHCMEDCELALTAVVMRAQQFPLLDKETLTPSLSRNGELGNSHTFILTLKKIHTFFQSFHLFRQLTLT